MAELIAAGSGAASAEFTLANGERATLYIKQKDSAEVAYQLDHKTSGGGYEPFARLDTSNTPINVDGNGTFRLSRIITGKSSGVDNG